MSECHIIIIPNEYPDEPPNPNSNYPPYNVRNWIAIGDSFSAGPGAGKEWNDGKDGRPSGGSGHCMRRLESYPPVLQADAQMPGPNGPQSGKPSFNFVSCTGDTTVELLDTTIQNNQLEQIQGQTDLVTLSIGGNDVLFAPILKGCILGASFGCDEKKKSGLDVLYSTDFHKRYNQVLTKIVQEKLQWSTDSAGHTSLYVTSYMQFFDDWTDQCDQATFSYSPFAKKVKKEVRREMNHMANQLNEVLQYKIDLRNVDWTGYMWKSEGPEHLYTAVQFVDMDWKYLDHRFCREGIKEPTDDPDTWFFHLKIFGSNGQSEFDESQKDNETYIDEISSMTWTPGKNGEPPFDENDPVQVENEETRTRTFHPKPAGFKAEAKNLIDMLYEDTLQTGLAGKHMYFLCIGDVTSLGEHRGFRAETRFGYIPYLDKILNRQGNFDGELRHQFIGREGGQYAGDYFHEIYPWASSLGQIATAAVGSPFLHNPLLRGRIVVPIMLGAKDLMLGRKVDDVLPELHWLLKEIWKADDRAVVLLATIPMMGDFDDEGDEFWPLQRAAIEWNAKIAALVNYYARKEKRPIVKVHMSTTQREHIDNNIYIPNAHGYRRMAFDWLSGLVQANERHFFDGDRWKMEIPPFASYDLDEIDEEIKKDMPTPICVQNRNIAEGDDGPKVEDITKSLFRDAKDRQDWVENYACNPEVQCTYSLDVEVSFLRYE
jgi:lysophospholipase L1-like esterase